MANYTLYYAPLMRAPELEAPVRNRGTDRMGLVTVAAARCGATASDSTASAD
jgi:hypothetical protein